MKRIAVEKSLNNVKDFLSHEGYDVVDFQENNSDISNFDAIVVSGLSNNFLGMQNTTTKAPVISADGCTPADVKDQIDSALR